MYNSRQDEGAASRVTQASRSAEKQKRSKLSKLALEMEVRCSKHCTLMGYLPLYIQIIHSFVCNCATGHKRNFPKGFGGLFPPPLPSLHASL